MNCVIIDDDYPARLLLEGYANRIPYLKLLKSFSNPAAADPFITENQVDLFLLDIQMPQMTGLEFLKSFREKPKTILTTAYPDYALESYDLDVVDYLVKPIAFERFRKATDKAYQHYEALKNAASEKHYLLLNAGHKTYKIYLSDILFIEGAREYVVFHTLSGKIMTLESLKKLEQSLPAQFVRIHKSYIVNKDKVSIQHGTHMLQIDARILPIGKSYRSRIFDIFS